MKNFLFTSITIFTFAIAFSSCSKDDTIKPITPELNRAGLSQSLIVSDYTNSEDLSIALEHLITDSKGLIAAEKDITDIVFDIRFSEGKAIVSEVLFVNKDNQTAEQLQLDPNSGSFTRVETEKRIPSLFGNCPKGYSSLGTCGHNANETTCVAGLINGFLTQSLAGVGDCAGVQVSVGLFLTRVCGQTC